MIDNIFNTNPVDCLFRALYEGVSGNADSLPDDAGFIMLCLIGFVIILFTIILCVFIAVKLSEIASTLSSLNTPLNSKNDLSNNKENSSSSGLSEIDNPASIESCVQEETAEKRERKESMDIDDVKKITSMLLANENLSVRYVADSANVNEQEATIVRKTVKKAISAIKNGRDITAGQLARDTGAREEIASAVLTVIRG